MNKQNKNNDESNENENTNELMLSSLSKPCMEYVIRACRDMSTHPYKIDEKVSFIKTHSMHNVLEPNIGQTVIYKEIKAVEANFVNNNHITKWFPISRIFDSLQDICLYGPINDILSIKVCLLKCKNQNSIKIEDNLFLQEEIDNFRMCRPNINIKDHLPLSDWVESIQVIEYLDDTMIHMKMNTMWGWKKTENCNILPLFLHRFKSSIMLSSMPYTRLCICVDFKHDANSDAFSLIIKSCQTAQNKVTTLLLNVLKR